MPTKDPCIGCRERMLRLAVVAVGIVTPVAILRLLLPLGISVEGAIVTAKWLAVPWFAGWYVLYVWLVSRMHANS